MAGKLTMRIGVKPTGPDGTFTRRDHLRGAGWAFGVVVGLVVIVAIDAFAVAQWNDQHLDGIYAGVLIMCWFGILMAGLACLASLIRAAVGR